MSLTTIFKKELINLSTIVNSKTNVSLRKINIANLISLLCFLTTGLSPAFRDIALQYNLKFGVKISKQAFYYFFRDHFESILINFIQFILFERQKINTPNSKFPFKRILLHDSTTLALPPTAIEKYNGLVNGKGCKIQTYFDVMNNCLTELEITPFTINDQKYSHEIINIVKENDLIIRDLGYFSTASLIDIYSQNAFFVSKIPTTTNFFDENGKEFDLLEYLKKYDSIDQTLHMTKKYKLQVRVIARRTTEENGNRRRQKKKSDRKQNPSKRSLALLSWDIIITNIFDESIEAKTLFNLYKLRWKIEIIFKSWKSYCKVGVFHERISGKQITIYLLLRLLSLILMNNYIGSVVFNKAREHKYQKISYLSFMKHLIANFNKILQCQYHYELEDIISTIIEYSTYENRPRRKNLLEIENSIFEDLFQVDRQYIEFSEYS